MALQRGGDVALTGTGAGAVNVPIAGLAATCHWLQDYEDAFKRTFTV